MTTSFRQADSDTFIGQTVQAVYAGHLSGPVVVHIDIIVHPRWLAQRQGPGHLHLHAGRDRTVGNDRAGVAARRQQSRLERGEGGQARPPSPREPLPCL